VRQLVEALLASLQAEERADLLEGSATLAAPLFDPAQVAAEPAADSSLATLHGLYWLTANLAARQPLLLVLDDLHWCDLPSLRWLAYLLPRMEGSASWVRHRFVQTSRLRVHIAEAGEGEPVLLLHGWPQHWYAWRNIIPLLAANHRLISPDLRGFGWTDAPRHGYGTAPSARIFSHYSTPSRSSGDSSSATSGPNTVHTSSPRSRSDFQPRRLTRRRHPHAAPVDAARPTLAEPR
jgi:hypothetical protein